jgi:hypothetical protein
MKKIINTFKFGFSLLTCLDFIAFCLMSCGELVDSDSMLIPSSMTISRKHVYIMQGDSLQLQAEFVPDTVSNKSVFWFSKNNDVAEVRDGMIKAKVAGETQAFAVSVLGPLTDSCMISVIPTWYMNPYDYQYDMVIYAHVSVNGEELNDRMVIGAFCGEELRGVGVICESHDIKYLTLRIYSPKPSGEIITLRCYHHDTVKFENFTNTYTFDGGAHGSLSRLEELVIP